MGWVLLSRIAAVAFVIALPVFLVTTNVRYLAGEQRFYERGFRVHDADLTTGLPLSELDRAAGEIQVGQNPINVAAMILVHGENLEVAKLLLFQFGIGDVESFD